MKATGDPLFSDHLMERFAASISASQAIREQIIHGVMHAANLDLDTGREGTSGAANAYVVLLGSEFGTESSSTRPHYSPTMPDRGWQELWRLRVGEPNPHFDPRWASLRSTTTLWQRLFDWLPDSFENRDAAHTMFVWANLSVTAGGAHLGSKQTHADGMAQHVVPLIAASCARVVVATNEPVRLQLDRWALEAGGTRVTIADIEAWRVDVGSRVVFAAKVGHPSRGVSRANFGARLRALVASAESDAG